VGSIPITRSSHRHRESLLKKLLKIFAIVAAVVVVLFIAAAVVLTIVVNPNRYRDDIVRVVKEQTGRDLKIDGKLSLSFYPWIGLETKRLELSNASGFGKEPFAVIDSTETKVELLPLLRGNVVVGAVRLNGLKLHLARNASGTANWDDLTKQPAEKPAAKPAPTKQGGGAALAAFTINTFQVRNSEFTWRDDATKQQYAVRGLDLTSGNLLGGAPAPFKVAFNLESKSPPVKERVELNSKLNFDIEKEMLNIPELSLSLGDLRVKARMTVKKALSTPAAAGAVEIPVFDARALLGRLGIDYQPTDANAMRKVGLSVKIAYDPLATTLSDLALTLDNTRVTGDLAVRTQPAPAYRFNLVLDDINIDRYLPAAEKAAKGKEQADKAKPVVIPIALLRETHANGELRIGKLKAFGIHSQDITVKIAAKDGRITLGPNAAKLYAGAYSGRTVIDASGKTPQFRFEERLAGVQLGPFLKDAQVFDRFTGAGNVSLSLTAQGLDAEQIKRTLTGPVAVAVKEGAIEGIDLAKTETKIKEIRSQSGGDVKKMLASLPSITPEKGDKTTFTKLQANAVLTNGLVNNKDLTIEAPHLRVNGSGNVNLVTETFDNYLLRIGDFPLIVSGTFDSPKFRPDWNAIYREKAEQKVEQKKEEIKEELRDKLRNRLLDKLRR
jgi:AsmA protein